MAGAMMASVGRLLVAGVLVAGLLVAGLQGVLAVQSTASTPGGGPGEYAEAWTEIANVQNCSYTGGSCPAPYVRLLGGECLFVSKHALSWLQAREHCKGLMGDLATPKNLFILKNYIIHNPDYSGISAVFLGGRKYQGRWWWLDGRQISSEDFAEGEPNNYFGREDCIDLRLSRHPMLNDNKCNSPTPFVCRYCDFE
ncbi:C-type lectin-like isoform X2 [Procambarus clarkii]|uniref:C-type lectin-like isoform X2 n=1 Tax=Procambarus clarkii TaxID=6728 RepID=UPI001E6701AF|nr:C-type lectin-like isoform X2 [Procambarus clarkii]